MWVIINKTYTGPLGMFFAGQKYEIPKETVKQLRSELGEKNVVETCAPWDEHKDHKAAKAAEAKQKVNAAIAKVGQLQAELKSLREVAARINGIKKEFDDATTKAKGLAKAAGIDWPPAAKKDSGNP